jgi:hypothetical protein
MLAHTEVMTSTGESEDGSVGTVGYRWSMYVPGWEGIAMVILSY